jgi:hypothetical protein
MSVLPAGTSCRYAIGFLPLTVGAASDVALVGGNTVPLAGTGM